jgi:hypothetical protein
MQKLLENTSPTKQNQQLNASNIWNNNLLSIAMTAINSLADRHLPKQAIRTAKVPTHSPNLPITHSPNLPLTHSPKAIWCDIQDLQL